MSIEQPELGEIRRGYEIGKTNTSSKNRFIWYPCERCRQNRWVQYEKGKPSSPCCRKCAYIVMGENNFIPLKPKLPNDHMPIEGEIRTSEEIGAVVGWEGNWIWNICHDCGNGRWSHCVKGKPVSQRCLKCGNRNRVAEYNKKFPTPEEIAQYSPQLGDIRYGKDIGIDSSSYWERCACVDCKEQDWIRIKKDSHQINYRCFECFQLSRAIKPIPDDELSKYIPQIGDIKHRKALGLGEKGKVIWNSCTTCGKTRWSRLVKSKAESATCIDCDRIRTSELCKSRMKTPYLTPEQLSTYTPNIGDILHAREVGRAGNCRFIYNRCNSCHNGFWIIMRGGKPRTNQCYECSKYNKTGKIDKAYKLLEECSDCHNIYPATPQYFRPAEDVYSGIRTQCIKCWRRKSANYSNKRRKENPIIRLNFNMSHYMYMALRENKAGKHWEDLVGYTIQELKEHLEKLFVDGMSWENYGWKNNGWHVDHVQAKAHFNYKTPKDFDFKRCWSLENLQPLWGKDNLSKGKKINGSFQPGLALHIEEKRGIYVA